jgi:putative transposase
MLLEATRMATFKRMVIEPTVQRRSSYPSDLTEEQWELLRPLLPENHGSGQPTKVELREVLNALLYMKQTGCQWRYLPHDFPPRSTVFYYFEKWSADGTLEEVMAHLREQVRVKAGRARQPTGAILDSQTVKTAGPGIEVGWDGGK